LGRDDLRLYRCSARSSPGWTWSKIKGEDLTRPFRTFGRSGRDRQGDIQGNTNPCAAARQHQRRRGRGLGPRSDGRRSRALAPSRPAWPDRWRSGKPVSLFLCFRSASIALPAARRRQQRHVRIASMFHRSSLVAICSTWRDQRRFRPRRPPYGDQALHAGSWQVPAAVHDRRGDISAPVGAPRAWRRSRARPGRPLASRPA
jgi:hypothetical protein